MLSLTAVASCQDGEESMIAVRVSSERVYGKAAAV